MSEIQVVMDLYLKTHCDGYQGYHSGNILTVNLDIDLIEKIIIETYNGHYQSSIDFISKYREEKHNNLTASEIIVLNLFDLHILWRNRTLTELPEKLSFFEKLVNDQQEKHQWIEFELIRFKGIYAILSGNLIDAEKILTKGIELCSEDFLNILYKAIFYNMLGYIYRMQGKVELALRSLYSALPILEETKSTIHLANCLENLSLIHFSLKTVSVANEQLQRSLKLRRLRNDPFYISWTLYNLCNLHLEEGNDQFDEYLTELKKIAENSDSPIVTSRYYIIDALKLMEEKRYQNKYQARVQLEQIIQTSEVYEHKVRACLGIVRNLLEELELFHDDTIFEEVNQKIEKLIEDAKRVASFGNLVNIYILKSKMYIVQDDLSSANLSLEMARGLANEHKLYSKIEFIEIFQDYLDSFHIQPDDHALLRTKFNTQSLVKELFQHGSLAFMNYKEKPKLFMIMTDYGSVYYQISLTKMKMNQHLMANFFSAITTFSEELLDEKSETNKGNDTEINELHFRDNTIILKNVDSLIFVYIYEGLSLQAKSMLNHITEMILEENFIQPFTMGNVIENLNERDSDKLDRLIHAIIEDHLEEQNKILSDQYDFINHLDNHKLN